MADGIGLREFGRMIGLSGEAIRKAIKTGRIPAHMVGAIALSTGRTRPVITDPEGARAALNARTMPQYRQDSEAISRGRRAAAAKTPPPPPRKQPADDDRPRAPSIAD